MIKWLKLTDKHPKDKNPKKPTRCLVWIKEKGYPNGYFDFGAYNPINETWFLIGGMCKDEVILFWSELNDPKGI